MLKWFKNCKSVEDVKRRYKELIKEYHPDISGKDTTADMSEINAEYERAFEMLKNVHRSESGATYTKQDKTTAETPEQFREIINSLIHCEGLIIDLVGSWIWLSGNTYAHRDTIKRLGFRWASSKKSWYWRAEENAVKSHRRMSLDEIKIKYGCERFQATAPKELAASY